MRQLIALAVLVVVGLGLAGCAPRDSHEAYLRRNIRLTQQADWRSLWDDLQMHVAMDHRPSHLSVFTQE